MTRDARCALITGASSGIGEAVARMAADAGYRVAIAARRGEELDRVRRSLARSEEHLGLVCDVSDEASVAQAFRQVGEAFGRLDLLVNNAGSGYRARVEDLDVAVARRVLDTNVIGILLCAKHALPWLKRGRESVVVNISSVVGRRAVPGQALYSASKAAVCSIGEALRIEWAGHDIAVCTLNPGLTSTGFFAAQVNPEKLADPALATAASAREVARAVLELDRAPRPEVFLRPKWRWLAALSMLAPRRAESIFVRRIGESWRVPRR
ncbi:MAG TPA: SDR family oxidoreductase [Planctomycetota bacterium]|nr:SDR family oxidoreductase [Planctomycetota bacterium]